MFSLDTGVCVHQGVLPDCTARHGGLPNLKVTSWPQLYPSSSKCPLGSQAPSPTRQGLACSLTAPAQGSCVEKPCTPLGTWLLASDLGMEPRCQAGHPRLLPGRVLDTQVEGNGKCHGTPTLSRQLRWKLAPSFGAHPSAGTHIFKARAGGRVPC